MESKSSPKLTPEYINEFNGKPLLVVSSVFIALETIAVLSRFWSRRIQRTPWAWDDFLIVPAWVTCLVEAISGYVFVNKGGSGRHALVIAAFWPEKITFALKASMAFVTVYFVSVTITKLVILAFFLRSFGTRSHLGYRYTCFALMVILIATCIANLFAHFLRCRPLSKYWNPELEGYCFNQTAFSIWSTFPNIVTDVIMLLLPFRVVWDLRTGLSTKLGLIFVFLTGSL